MGITVRGRSSWPYMHLWNIHVRASPVKIEASGVYSDTVAAGITRTRATDIHDRFFELLASYFLPTFPLLPGSLSNEKVDGEATFSLASTSWKLRRPDFCGQERIIANSG